MTRTRYKTEVKLFALNLRAEGKKWKVIRETIKERFNVNPPGVRAMEKWEKSLDSKKIAAELMKEAEAKRPQMEFEAKAKIMQGLVPVLQDAQKAGGDVEEAAWKWFFQIIESMIGYEKFEQWASEYFARREKELSDSKGEKENVEQ